MMHNVSVCPECGNSITQSVDTQFFDQEGIIERVYTCDECITEWTGVYSADEIQNVIDNS